MNADGTADDGAIGRGREPEPDVVAWLREHPEDWKYATAADMLAANPSAHRVLDETYRRRAAASAAPPAGARTRWRWAVAIGAAAILAGGTAAALVWGQGQPRSPEAGAVCRREARTDADGVVIAAGADPIEQCRIEWTSGEFRAMGSPVPPLVACIGSGGAIEVFPGDGSTCNGLGLAVADPVLSPENQAVVDLQNRLVDEINAKDCRSVADVLSATKRIVAEEALKGWRVIIGEGSANGACGKVAVEAATRTVTVLDL